MARPEQEWPIPVYVAELRERVIMACRVPLSALARRVPAPLAPELVRGAAVAALCFSNGRCVRPVGGVPSLASEFHLVELITPVVWRPACRPVVRGHLLLELLTDSPGIARLVRKSVELEARPCTQLQSAAGQRYTLRMRSAAGGVDADLSRADDGWPGGSRFDSPEEAEALMAAPECCFAGKPGGPMYAIPVHQYARSMRAAGWRELELPLLSALLGARAEQVEVDHVLFQKRCTHTWSFPPERVPVVGCRASGVGGRTELQPASTRTG